MQELKELILTRGQILKEDQHKLPQGVLCKVVYPISNIDEKNQNNRVYEREVWDKVIADEAMQKKMVERTLFGQAEHPAETQSDLQLTSHVITKTWIDEKTNKVMQEMDILDTPCGRIVDTILKADCQVGVSTRAEGELEEVTESGKDTYYRVIPESYVYVTTDFTADPSTFDVTPRKVERNIVKGIQAELQNEKIGKGEKRFATLLLESIKKVKEDLNTNVPDKKKNSSEVVVEGQKVKIIEGENKDKVGTVDKIKEGRVMLTLEDGTTISTDIAGVIQFGEVEVVPSAGPEPIEEPIEEPEAEEEIIEPGPEEEEIDSEEEEETFESKERESLEKETDKLVVDVIKKTSEAKIDEMSSWSRAASTDEQEDAITELERSLDKLGKQIVGGTTIGKAPQTVILDLTHQGNEMRVNSDGEVEIKRTKVDPSNVEEIKAALEESKKTSESKTIKEIQKILKKNYGDRVQLIKEKSSGQWVFKYEEEVDEAKMGVDYLKTMKASVKTASSALKDKDYDACAKALEDVADDASDGARAAKKMKREDDAKAEADKEKVEEEKVDEFLEYSVKYEDVSGELKTLKQTIKASDTIKATEKAQELLGEDAKIVSLDVVSASEEIEEEKMNEREDAGWVKGYLERAKQRDELEGVRAEVLVDSLCTDCGIKMRYHEIEDGKKVCPAEGKEFKIGPTESKSISSISGIIRDLKIKEAGTRAEREKAIELLEEFEKDLHGINLSKALETKILIKKLKEAQVVDSLEVKALCKKLEERTKAISKIKDLLGKLRESYNRDIKKLREKVNEQDKEYQDKIDEEKKKLKEKYNEEFIKKYVDFKIESFGVKIHESSRALLEKRTTTEEVDTTLEEIRNVMRQSALHPGSLTKIVVEIEKDPVEAQIESVVENLGF